MTNETPGLSPPYVSYRTLLSQIERMEIEGTPSKIDKHFLVGMAGGTQNHFRQGLRSMGLVDEDSRPTELLHNLVAVRGRDRAEMFAALVAVRGRDRAEMFAAAYRDRFSPLFALPDNASKSEFFAVLDEYGVRSADQQRKVLSFFVAMADAAGVTVSTYIRPSKSHTGPRGPRRTSIRRGTTKPRGGGAEDAPRVGNDAKSGALSEEAMRGMYFKLLLDKAEKADGDSDLLDRIERLVGVSAGNSGGRGAKPAESPVASPDGAATNHSPAAG